MIAFYTGIGIAALLLIHRLNVGSLDHVGEKVTIGAVIGFSFGLRAEFGRVRRERDAATFASPPAGRP